MSITFEEISADVLSDEPREEPREAGGEADAGGLALAEKIRAVLIREKRRLERLSDQ